VTQRGNHGEIEAPGQWTIVCEGRCHGQNTFVFRNESGLSDADARAAFARLFAQDNGWYVALDRGDRDVSKDLCPGCAPPMFQRVTFRSRVRL
jgi:hypothetical protein